MSCSLICPKCEHDLENGQLCYDSNTDEWFYPVKCKNCDFKGTQRWKYAGFQNDWDDDYEEDFGEYVIKSQW